MRLQSRSERLASGTTIPSRRGKARFKLGYLASASSFTCLFALQAGSACAGGPVLPTGGAFTAGAGAISSGGAGALTINQTSLRGIITWNSFSIGAGGGVQINNGMGATLNR